MVDLNLHSYCWKEFEFGPIGRKCPLLLINIGHRLLLQFHVESIEGFDGLLEIGIVMLRGWMRCNIKIRITNLVHSVAHAQLQTMYTFQAFLLIIFFYNFFFKWVCSLFPALMVLAIIRRMWSPVQQQPFNQQQSCSRRAAFFGSLNVHKKCRKDTYEVQRWVGRDLLFPFLLIASTDKRNRPDAAFCRQIHTCLW